MKNEIRRNWLLSHSRKEVWNFLTQSELLEQWLMPNDFVLKLGHEFTFKTNPIPSLDLSGTFHCKVTEIISEEKLVNTWNGGLDEQNPTLKTLVEWTLFHHENGTELKLYHSGFNNSNQIILTSMFKGWDDHIQLMIKNLNPQ